MQISKSKLKRIKEVGVKLDIKSSRTNQYYLIKTPNKDYIIAYENSIDIGFIIDKDIAYEILLSPMGTSRQKLTHNNSMVLWLKTPYDNIITDTIMEKHINIETDDLKEICKVFEMIEFNKRHNKK